MADFPINPIIGTTFTALDGTVWTWDGYSWHSEGGMGGTGGGGSTTIITNTFTANANQTIFTLTVPALDDEYIIVSRNGVVLLPNIHYTLPANGNTITLTSNTSANDLVEARIFANVSIGAAGPQGTTGAGGQGATGAQGSIGAGSQGAIGAGSQGATGTQGAEGSQGATGTGIQGPAGSAQGATGAQGSIGTGIQGATGVGTQGATGTQGSTGTQGTTGTQGALGTQGSTGVGTQGTTGTQGVTGIQGAVGTQGTQGATGAGTQGVQGVTGGTATDDGAEVTSTANTSVIDNTTTVISFNNEVRDDGSYFASPNTQFKVTNAGWYELSGQVSFDGNATGVRRAWWRKNGSATDNRYGQTMYSSKTGGAEDRLNATTSIYLNTNDYVELCVFQNSGSTLNVVANTTTVTPRATIHRLGAQVGSQGTTGAGTQGATGTQGTTGTTGTQGAIGAGTQGATGTQGVDGTQGTQGATGAGTQGTTGSQGATGSGGGGSSEATATNRVIYYVKDTLIDPPASGNVANDTYRVGALGGNSGAWLTPIYYDDGNLARWNGSAWNMIVPEQGDLVFNAGGPSEANNFGLAVIENANTSAPRSYVFLDGVAYGSDTQIQFNNEGYLDGSPDFTFNLANSTFKLNSTEGFTFDWLPVEQTLDINANGAYFGMWTDGTGNAAAQLATANVDINLDDNGVNPFMSITLVDSVVMNVNTDAITVNSLPVIIDTSTTDHLIFKDTVGIRPNAKSWIEFTAGYFYIYTEGDDPIDGDGYQHYALEVNSANGALGLFGSARTWGVNLEILSDGATANDESVHINRLGFFQNVEFGSAVTIPGGAAAENVANVLRFGVESNTAASYQFKTVEGGPPTFYFQNRSSNTYTDILSVTGTGPVDFKTTPTVNGNPIGIGGGSTYAYTYSDVDADSNYPNTGELIFDDTDYTTSIKAIIHDTTTSSVDIGALLNYYSTLTPGMSFSMMVQQVADPSIYAAYEITAIAYNIGHLDTPVLTVVFESSGGTFTNGDDITVTITPRYRGAQGVQGTTGIQGAGGIQGAFGTQGVQGLDGAFAAQGIAGAQGLTGTQGVTPRNVNFIISGGGGLITTGAENTAQSKGVIEMTNGGTITGWGLYANTGPANANIVVDVWTSTYANYPNTMVMISGTGPPRLDRQAANQQSNTDGWTSGVIASGNLVEFRVNSAVTPANTNQVTVVLRVT